MWLTAASFVVLISFKLFWDVSQTLPVSVLFDLIVFLIVFLFFTQLQSYLKFKNTSTITLVLNIGILIAFVFLLLSFGETLLNNFVPGFSSSALVKNLINAGYLFFFIGFLSYLLLILREFYFLKRIKDNSVYYWLLLAFLFFSGISFTIFKDSNSAVSNAFFIVAIILISLNSLRISWIAFHTKKEKIGLLFFSSVISALFILSIVYSYSSSFHEQTISSYSTGFYVFSNLMLIYGAVYFGVLFFTTLFHIPTAEVFDRKAQEVTSLQNFSSLINQVLDFDDLAKTVTEITQEVSSADASWILIKNDDGFTTIANRNIAYVDADKINGYIMNSGECENMLTTKICNLNKAYVIAELSEKFSSVAVSPLKGHSEIKGYLMAAKKNELIFFDDDKKAINTFSDYASVAIENSRLLKESIEKERLEKELDVAREIQKKILPSNDPVYDDISVSSVFIPAFEVGGDYYDYFENEDNKFGFVIADVSGKGISAAFVMSEIKGIFESLSKIIKSPKEILVNANQVLKRTLNKRIFISALYGSIDRKKGVFTFSRAGHCPVIIIRDGEVLKFKPTGVGLGLDYSENFNSSLEENNFKLEEGDTIILYTDGITEAKDKNFEDFGEERFFRILKANGSLSVNELTKKIVQEVTLFSRNFTQYDDITLVILRWKKNNIGEKNG